MSSVRSALEIVAIEEIRKLTADQRHAIFTPGEQDELSGKHIQSTAGFYAVKKALTRLLPGTKIREFILGHETNGKPVIISGPQSCSVHACIISITHTREYAYGFASLQEQV